MTRPIRAYLMVRAGLEDWSVHVCRDLEAVLEAWEAPLDADHTGVLHIGFDRPPSTAFESVAQMHPGRLLLTAAAKHGMPQGYEATEVCIGWVNDLPVHLGTRGWGYILEEEDIPRAAKAKTVEAAQEPSGWVAAYVSTRPDVSVVFRTVGIFDDGSYLELEGALSWQERYHAGIFRFNELLGARTDDPCEIARAAPPWLAERPFELIGVPVRVANVFRVMGINTVAELQHYEVGELIRFRNFGRKSVNDLAIVLLRAVNDGPISTEARIAKSEAANFRMELHRTLGMLKDRERDILTRRMGLEKPAQTLQVISEDYGITRERVRQIEARVVKRLVDEHCWDDLLRGKLETLLVGREFPLPLLGVEAVDDWFAGVSDNPEALKYILSEFCGNHIGVVRIDEVDYLGFLRQREWDSALGEARRILSFSAGKSWTEGQCEAMVTPLLNESAREFRQLLWDKASRLCHFSEADEGERLFISYGRGAEQVVEAVLTDAEHPMHYSEIAERAFERTGQPSDIHRIHGAAAAVGILFSRGTYGLEKHLRISAEEADRIRDEAEDMVLSGPSGRQWHANEIYSELLDRYDHVADLNKYTLDFLLRKSAMLKPLGRMTWTEDGGTAESTQRIDIRQSVVSLIQQAGRPLTTNEVRQRLVALRGLDKALQILPGDPLIRVGAGLWGLNDRDLPVKRADQPVLVEHLLNVLRTKGSGIHVSEADSLKLEGWPSLTPSLAFAIAAQDPRICVSLGQHLYLDEWGEPRRESLLEAVRNVLTVVGRPLPLEAIAENCSSRLGRQLDRDAVSACLQTIDAFFDVTDRTWSLKRPLLSEPHDYSSENLDIPG